MVFCLGDELVEWVASPAWDWGDLHSSPLTEAAVVKMKMAVDRNREGEGDDPTTKRVTPGLLPEMQAAPGKFEYRISLWLPDRFRQMSGNWKNCPRSDKCPANPISGK